MQILQLLQKMDQLSKLPKLIQLPKFNDKRGNLTYFENEDQIPFIIKRTYWIYDVPGGEFYAGYAYRENEDFIIALSGSFDIVIDDGIDKKIFNLNRPYYGLYIPKMYWREMNNFSINSLALVVSNTGYNEDDCIYDYKNFCEMRKSL